MARVFSCLSNTLATSLPLLHLMKISLSKSKYHCNFMSGSFSHFDLPVLLFFKVFSISLAVF